MPTDSQGYTGLGGTGARSGVFHVTSSLSFATGSAPFFTASNGSESFSFTSAQAVSGAEIKFQLRGRPRIIDGFKWYFNGGTATTGATWVLEGSNDDSTWDTLHTFAFDPTLTGVTKTGLGGGDYYIEASFSNSTEYAYYRILGTGGGNTTNTTMRRIEFSIQGNEYESGDRITGSLVTVTTNMTLTDSADFFFDGATDTTAPRYPFEGTGTGKYLKMAFPEAICIDRVYMQWQDVTSQAMGTWQWQGSNDDSTWDVLKADFSMLSIRGDDTDGGSYHALTNTTDYFYYQLICTSGTIFDKRGLEILFNVASGGAPDVLLSAAFVDESEFDATLTLGFVPVALVAEFVDDASFIASLTLGPTGGDLSAAFEDDSLLTANLTLGLVPIEFQANFEDGTVFTADLSGEGGSIPVIQSMVIVTGR